MSRDAFALGEEISDYVAASSLAPDDVQAELINETAQLGGPSQMQIGSAQGAFLEALVGAIRPRFAIEIGTFTGYSSICIARGLAPDGKLLCCDISQEWTDVARRYWDRAGVADAIDLRIGSANDTLASLDPNQTVDFAFIDADKTGYLGYYETLLPRLADGGVIAVDNTLWGGAVLDQSDTTPDTVAIRDFNTKVSADPRVVTALTPIGDGLTIIRKR
ncbi:MAG: O-methyltransferase [Acidimicrobiales bacterium]